MFAQTRIRLTALNAAVFFIILAFIGVIVYTELRHQLYANVDESLRLRLTDIRVSQTKYVLNQQDAAVPPFDQLNKRMLIQVQGIDPRVFIILWDENGDPFPIPMGKGSVKSNEMDAFKPYRSIRTAETVQIGGHAYRVYGVDYDGSRLDYIPKWPDMPSPPLISEGLQTSPPPEVSSRIVAVQAISIIDSEQGMLKKLLELILLGIIGGGAVTVLAGLYLANQALLPIKRSWAKQEQFVADASHELRMPLSIIRANAELVFRHPDSTILEMSEPISMVLAESKRMGKLTEQLLTLARADSNQEEIVAKPLLLDELVGEVAQKFEPLAELKSLKLETSLESGLETMGDRERLHQLLVILLDNSMKFTPEDGTIRIHARKAGSYAEIAVDDTGCGIAADELPHIFDRFYRGDKMRSRATDGTGLGLAIAKWIAAKHGGHIHAASTLGRGTSITVRLPAGHRKHG